MVVGSCWKFSRAAIEMERLLLLIAISATASVVRLSRNERLQRLIAISATVLISQLDL